MTRNRIVFATFFPTCTDGQLTKDVGKIPFILHRDYGYESYVICYENGDYPSLEGEVSGLRLLLMNTSARRLFHGIVESLNVRRPLIGAMLELVSTLLDSMPIILRYARRIDVFHLMHLKAESLAMALAYRIVNRRGIIYLKVDADPRIMELCEKMIWKLYYYLAYVPLRVASPAIISIETRTLCEWIRARHPLLRRFACRILHIPNGVDVNSLRQLTRDFHEKEDIVIHAGRIGSPQKGSELVVEAFARVHNEFPNWKLVLIGHTTADFARHLRNLLKRNQGLERKISCLGYVDRAKLYEYYSKAKILAFPSRFEGFALVPLEAGFFGDIVLGTDIPSTREMTNDGRFACLCPVDDIQCFTSHLRYLLSHQDCLEEKSRSIMAFVAANFSWSKICGTLHESILRASACRPSARKYGSESYLATLPVASKFAGPLSRQQEIAVPSGRTHTSSPNSKTPGVGKIESLPPVSCFETDRRTDCQMTHPK